MIAQMYLMLIDTEEANFEEAPQVEKKITDFVFDIKSVTGVYKQDDEIMLIILDGVDIPLVWHEYTYNCIVEEIESREG